MAKLASKVVNQAVKWLGRNEANGTHKAIIDIYNSHKPLARGYAVKYSDEWCATFVSAIAVKLGYTDIIPTECSCNKMIDLFKKLGRWKENENRKPKAGDIIFYDWQDSGYGDNRGSSDHVGIVEKVSGDTITIIEGNCNERVARRTLKVNNRYIRGYAVPKYDAEPKKEVVSKNETTTKKSITTVAKEVIADKWGKGEERKKRLKNAGYDADKVQAKVNELMKKENTTKKSITAIAKEVIAGKWGDGEERKKKLKAAGYDVKKVQAKVNELYK